MYAIHVKQASLGRVVRPKEGSISLQRVADTPVPPRSGTDRIDADEVALNSLAVAEAPPLLLFMGTHRRP